VDRRQAQSATNTDKRQTAVNTFDQFHEVTLARGIIITASCENNKVLICQLRQ
jgi:hypothetical protein